MTSLLLREDAPRPTKSQMDTARQAANREAQRTRAEMAAGAGLLLLSIALGVLTYWALTHSTDIHANTWAAGFIGALVSVFTFLSIIEADMHQGRPATPSMVQAFHKSEVPISKEQIAEVEILIKRNPLALDTVAKWAFAYNGVLLHRHLWELRRLMPPENYWLGIVETSGARDGNGSDLDVYFYEEGIDPPNSIADILGGRLLTGAV